MAHQKHIEFAEQILNLSDNAEVLQVAEKAALQIRKNYTTVNSRKDTFTSYRNAVKSIVCNSAHLEICLKVLKLTPDEQEQFKNLQRLGIKSNQGNRRLILDLDGYIEKAEQLVLSSSPAKMIVGLCALTGRRTFEIACQAVFEKSPKPAHLFFSGQAKAKESRDSFLIPVLNGDIGFCISGLEKLRQAKPELTLLNADAFHLRMNSNLNYIATRAFFNCIEGLAKPKDLRAVYACAAYQMFCENPQKISPMFYYSQVLGHRANDPYIAASYDQFALPSEVAAC